VVSDKVTQGERLAERDHEMWALHVRGWTQHQIAQKFRVSQGTVSVRLKQVRKDLPRATKDEVRDKHLAMMDLLRARLVALVERQAPPVFVGKDGDPARDPRTGEIVEDYAAMINATDRLLKIMEREAKQMGIDEPTRTSVEVTTVEAAPIDVELQALADELSMRSTKDKSNEDSDVSTDA
jgi:transcriptional regulator